MIETDDLRNRLEEHEPGLGKYAELLANAGFFAERLSDVSVRVLADLQIPFADRASLLVVANLSASPSLTGTSPASVEFPGGLGWIDAVSETWPSPIAHEYYQLRKLIEANRVEAAVWQLKDVAEVLVKLPALMLAQDILQHGTRTSRDRVRSGLFAQPLTFGVWLQFYRDKLAPSVKSDSASLLFPELLSLFLHADDNEKPKPTILYRAIDGILQFRNDVFGHGAFRPDLVEFVDEVVRLVRPLNAALGELSRANCWSGFTLKVAGSGGETLTGWRKIKERHDAVGSDQHRDVATPLILAKNDHQLSLWPLIGLRACAICGKRDVFLYDSRSWGSAAGDFVLLDYLAGHRMKKKSHQEGDLSKVAENIAFEFAEDSEMIGEDYGKLQFEELLLAKASSARYLPPGYLQSPLSGFIKTNKRGVFWLSGPGHVGKSVFVRGLTDREYQKVRVAELETSCPWLKGAVMCGFAIKREIQYTIRELENVIRQKVLQEGFGLKERTLDFPRLNLQEVDRSKAFANYLLNCMSLKPARVDRVVVCVDGLDEIRPTAGSSIADFLPKAEELPDNLYIILTSRPIVDCPSFVAEALKARSYGQEPCSLHVALEPEADNAVAAGYRDLLRAYYLREIKRRRKTILHEAFIDLRQNGRAINDDLYTIRDQPLREAAQNEWSDVSKITGLQEGEAVSLAALAENAVAPLDSAFNTIFVKAGGYFAFVAFLTDLVARGMIDPVELRHLPQEDRNVCSGGPGPSNVGKLYVKYLLDLAETLSGGSDNTKHWDYVRRILIVLAADQEAHTMEAEALKPAFPEYPYYGMRLRDLSNRVGESGITYKLVSAIYSFQALLAAWREEEATTSRYALGLKDLSETLRSLYGDELVAEHVAVVEEHPLSIDVVEASTSVEGSRRLVKAIIHAQLAPALRLATEAETESVATALRKAMQGRRAARDWKTAIVLGCIAVPFLEGQKSHLEKDRLWTPALEAAFARALNNRGAAQWWANNPNVHSTLKDFARAIETLEALKRRLDTEWPPEWDHDLANAYNNRAYLRDHTGSILNAPGAPDPITETNRAIELRTGLKRRLGAAWSEQMELDLAEAYAYSGQLHTYNYDENYAIGRLLLARQLLEPMMQRCKSGMVQRVANSLSNVYEFLVRAREGCGVGYEKIDAERQLAATLKRTGGNDYFGCDWIS
jgi:hypothetical protein